MVTELATASLDRVKGIIAEHASEVDKSGSFPQKSIKALGEAGYLGLVSPTSVGGSDANAVEYAQTVMEFASACGSTGMIFVMHCCGIEVIKQLMTEGTEKQGILRQAALGKHLSTLALSEPGCGINCAVSICESKMENGQFVLNGEKSFVTSGGQADSYVVTSKAVGSDDPTKTSFYLVRRGSAGQIFAGGWNGIGLRGNTSCAMQMRNLKVSESYLLGEAGAAGSLAVQVIMPKFLLGSAAVYTGIARAAFDETCKHVKERIYKHNNQALTELATIRRSVAEMKVAVDSAIAFVMHVAHEIAADPANPNLLFRLFEAKQIACKTAKEVTLAAMQICGGIAYSGATPIDRYMRDALAGSVMAPSSDVLLDLIGKVALDLPLE